MSPEEYSDVAKELVWEFNTNELVEALATTVVFILVAKLEDNDVNEPLTEGFKVLVEAIELDNVKNEPLIADEFGVEGTFVNPLPSPLIDIAVIVTHALMFPTTSNFSPGVAVPTPTF